VSDDQLTPRERITLLALLVAAREVTNAELRTATGVELTGPPRRRLNDLKLVNSIKRGRPFVHELTDAGASRCREELTAARPDRAGQYGGVLYAMLASLHRHIERSGPALGEIFKPDVERMVRHAYRELADGHAAPVRLRELRAKLDGVTKTDLDAELIRMADQPAVYLRATANQQLLTDEDRDAALRLGGEDRHILQIEAP